MRFTFFHLFWDLLDYFSRYPLLSFFIFFSLSFYNSLQRNPLRRLMKEKHLALSVWAVGPSWFLVHIWSQLYIHNDALAYTHSFLLMSLHHRGSTLVEDRFYQRPLDIRCNRISLGMVHSLQLTDRCLTKSLRTTITHLSRFSQ